MDLRTTTGLAGAASEPRTVARESGSATPTRVSAPRDTLPAPSDTSDRGAAQNAAPENVQTTAAGQFYVSPFLTFDTRSLTVIFQVRDTESGDVTRQFPAESAVERYRRDPSARPFVLPEPAGSGEAPAGPPPPTIGGPVAEAASQAEEQEVSGQTTQSPGPSNPAQAAVLDGSAPTNSPPRGGIDLVA